MNRQQIITADLCARLPYGVKILRPDGNTILELRGILGNLMQFQEDGNAHETFGSIKAGTNKPILFPSLTSPITVAGYNDGKPFVPIDELNRLAELKNLDLRVEWDESEDHFIIRVPYFMGGWEMDFVSNWLKQWHVNYRLLPGEYIEATNEYA